MKRKQVHRSILRSLILLSLSLLIMQSCSKKTSPGSTPSNPGGDFSGPPTIIYKTTSDYSNNVPVLLSDDKSDIVSFPAPGDLLYQGEPATPVTLKDGFLYDRRGINQNVAFLKFTYEEYIKMGKTPDKELLMKSIIDRNPLEVMYNCGNRYRFDNVVEELNGIITGGRLGSCRKLK